MSRPPLIALLLALMTLAIFLPAGRFDFLTYDDGEYITQNQVVQDGLTPAGVKWAFTTYHVGNWHPLTWLSHMADCTLFGVNAGAHHLVNVLFHSANAALVFLLFWQLTQKIWPSTLVAALFAWHPMHVESVAWVSERKDVLSTFFALLALLSYARFTKTNSRREFWLALVFFALGLLAKPMLVTLPFVMLLLDFWPLGRIQNETLKIKNLLLLVREKIPFFVLTAVSCIVTFLAQRTGQAVVPLDVVPLHYRIENSVVAAAGYLLKILWPTDLAVIYPFTTYPITTVLLAVGALVLVTAVVWVLRSRHLCWLVGWLWFLGMLVPVIGLVQVGGTVMADRYTYVPAIGIFAAVAFGLNALPWIRKYFIAVAIPVVIACVWLTEKQLGYWRNNETLFHHTIAVTHNNVMAHLGLGLAFEQQGRNVEALTEYREVARIAPTYFQIYSTIGDLLVKMGKPAEALAAYQEVIRLVPQNPPAHYVAGTQLAVLGRYAEASGEFIAVERLDPNYAAPHVENAKVLFKLGRDVEALDEFRAALRLEPGNFQTLATVAHYLAANENAAARDGRTALGLAIKADELSGHVQPVVLDIVGMAFAETGDFTNAIACAQRASVLATGAGMSDEPMKMRLELYRNRQPWRESFRATNAPPQAGIK